MKYIVVLFIAGGIFAALTHKPLVLPTRKPDTSDQIDDSTPGTDFLKAPLDRTHQVLDQAKTRAQDPALQ